MPVSSDGALDLKDLTGRLGAKHLSFGSPERLLRHLGVIPGAVSPAVHEIPPSGELSPGASAGHPASLPAAPPA